MSTVLGPPPGNSARMAPTPDHATAQVSAVPTAPRRRCSHFFMELPRQLSLGRLVQNRPAVDGHRIAQPTYTVTQWPTPSSRSDDRVAAFKGSVEAFSGIRHGPNVQIGLTGEVMFLTELLNKADELGLNSEMAIGCWTGWESASRDFKGGPVAVEVKATRSAE